MNLDQLNRWLGVIANLGVMIGLIFLIFELDQANRIAERDSRQTNARAIFDVAQLQLEMPGVIELRTKLRNPKPTLNAEERERAELLASVYTSIWGNLVIQESTDLLPESSLQFGRDDIDTIVDDLPGLAPFIEQWLLDRGVSPTSSASVWRHVWQAVERNLPIDS